MIRRTEGGNSTTDLFRIETRKMQKQSPALNLFNFIHRTTHCLENYSPLESGIAVYRPQVNNFCPSLRSNFNPYIPVISGFQSGSWKTDMLSELQFQD